MAIPGKPRRTFPRIRLTRDLALYLLGIAIIVNEVWLRGGLQTRPEVLMLGGAMVGLPVFLRRNGL